jgi:opacity protein-like surface antigen
LKSKILLSIAAAAAALMPLAAVGQVAPEKRPKVDSGAPAYKYEVYAGFAYTSMNQLNLSRYGLMGGKLALTRDFGRHFGITTTGDYYRPATGTGNPGNPTVWSITAGPEFRATLYGNVDGFVHVLAGGEHTGGENMTPDVSPAIAFGGGLLYNLSQRWAIRASGDKAYDRFSLANNTPQLDDSSHWHSNARATIGVVYRF